LNLFQDYVQRYNKPYINDTDTFLTRFLVFKESLRRHKWLNSYETENSGSAVYGVNKFSDLTPQEFKGIAVTAFFQVSNLLVCREVPEWVETK
jgi:cathepsin O